MLQKLTASSALGICAFGVFVFHGSALAKSAEHYFYPKMKWVVEGAQSTNDGALKSCTITNELNNGYIIQLAGTQDGFSNLNLDLRQEVFEKGLKYEVVYEVPGVKKAILPTKAFKKNVLVTDLRKQDNFIQSMREHGVVDINIRGNEFRVYMTGFDAKMQNFERCVQSGARVAASDHTSQAPTGHAQEHAISESSPASEALSRVVESREITVPEVSADLPEATKPVERQRYTEQIADQIKKGNVQYKPEEKVKSSPSPEIDEPEAAAAVQQKETVSQKPKETPYPVTHVKHTGTFDFTKEPEKKPEHISDVEPASGISEPAVVSNNDQHSYQQLSELRMKVSRLEEQNSLLDAELRTALAEGKIEQVSVSTDNWNLERATMRFNEAERQIGRLGRQLNSERARCDAEKKDLETMLFDPQLTDQSQLAKLSSLEAELEQSTLDYNRQQRQYNERIRLLEEQLNAQGR